ncbi:MAG TPA: uracil-DNA glycosylase [Candidatus Humimicrobiaceae bacterium]|nr:uracil-DNA glycosylase [Candidatus Humimicrobiaceae bacterium]
MKGEAEEELREVKEEVLSCQECPLCIERAKSKFYPVIGEGSHRAKIMFVGEAPGLNEAKTGRPFCGAAGKILDELLGSVGIKREDVYITNILKDRPPENRDPQPEEIKACTLYLERQIEIIKPKVICPLGRHSMKFLMEKFELESQIEGISKIHGKLFEINNFFQHIIIIPFYHPAVATYNPNMKKILKEDFKILKTI